MTEVTPSTSRNAASMHQKHPPAKVARPVGFSIFISFPVPVFGKMISWAGLANDPPHRRSRAANEIAV
jgi:hypothetical protein